MTEPLTQPTHRAQPRRRVWRALAASAFLLVTLSGVGLGAYTYVTTPERVAQAIQQAPIDGLVPACRSKVKEFLKSPGTATFGGEITAGTGGVGQRYTVTGWVDSQNGFGALVRNRYGCVAFRGETGWRAEDPIFTDW